MLPKNVLTFNVLARNPSIASDKNSIITNIAAILAPYFK